jgi:hypothetical protein
VFAFEGAERTDAAATPATQNQFKLNFCRELARLEAWAADVGWPADRVPELHVVVSDRFKISKSLVPVWSGRAGHMEFPVWRVKTGKAAIMHELVHVFFPNGNRFLAEGLAIYLQAAIGGNPAFPNFGRPLHGVAQECLADMPRETANTADPGLEHIHLAELDAIATPGPLTLRVGREVYGEDKRGQAFIYPLAGSFVQFLVETRGLETFRALYMQTPLVPLSQNAGAPQRWSSAYAVGLAELESEWKSMISPPSCAGLSRASTSCPLPYPPPQAGEGREGVL